MSFPYAPQVVAKLALTSQTAVLPLTTVYTPAVEGDYQVSVYFTATTTTSYPPGADGSISWTDTRAQTDHSEIDSGWGSTSTFSVCPHLPAGSPIQVQIGTYNDGGDPSFAYDLFVTVVQL